MISFFTVFLIGMDICRKDSLYLQSLILLKYYLAEFEGSLSEADRVGSTLIVVKLI